MLKKLGLADKQEQGNRKKQKNLAKKYEIVDKRAIEEKQRKQYQSFLDNEGRLPDGFIYKYDRTSPAGHVLHGTPFDACLSSIRDMFDNLHNLSGISEWIYYDNSVEINVATNALVAWVKRCREADKKLLHYDYTDSDGNKETIYFGFVGRRGYGNIMVVMDNKCEFENISKETLQHCREIGISFCTNVSFRNL